jgi:protein-disulfide isomerase
VPIVQAEEPLPSTPAPTNQPDAFGERVRAYLLAHPEVIVEAVQLYQQKQEAAQAEAAKQTLASKADEILRDPAAPIGGNQAGDVTLVEFFDYNCKYCRAVAPTVAEVLAADVKLRLAGLQGIPDPWRWLRCRRPGGACGVTLGAEQV